MDSNTTLNPGNRLLITWVSKAYKIEDRYLPSIHFWDSGPWQVLYFPLFLLSITFYFLIVCWLIFSIVFIILFLFLFYFSISFTFTLQILFDLVLHLLFYLVFVLLYLLSIYIIIPRNPLSQKCGEKTSSFILLFLQTYMKTRFTYVLRFTCIISF